MTSIRKRRRQIARIAEGPARSYPWVRISRYTDGARFFLYVPPDPEVQRQEFFRQLVEGRPPEPGEPPPMRGGICRIEGFRFIESAS